MAVVYLSSTLRDLKKEREAVAEWLGKNHQVKHSYVADDDSVAESCLQDIDICDIYVLILGFRYGFVPPDDKLPGPSITQLEFRRAGERGIPRIVLMSKGASDMSLTDFGNAQRYESLMAFRAEVSSAVRAAEFSDMTSLIAELSAGIQHVSGKQQVAKLPPPRLRLPQHKVVGRDLQIKAVLDGLAQGRRQFAFVFLAGVGKTVVAAELIDNPDVVRRFPDGVLWAHLGADPDVRRQLRKWATALGLSDSDLDKASNLGELSDLIAQAIDRRRLLLVVDDVWSTEVGEYFKFGGDACAYVVTTRFPKVARELMPTVGQVITVPTLGEEDGLSLLAELAPDSVQLAADLLRELVVRVGGLPIALVLIGNMLKAEGDNARAVATVEQYLINIAAMFRRKKPAEFAEEHNFTLGEVIEASYKALGKASSLNEEDPLPGDLLRGALEALSVLRPDPSWFTSSLAELITETSLPVLVDLANAGLIEEVHYPAEEENGNADRRYTMHRVIAEFVRTKLTAERAQALNRHAATYYLEQLQKLECAFQNGEDTNYSAMYRYENPDWQDCQDNWLYYFSQTGYDSEASLFFLNVWFDGFWWWSCFTDEGYDFCDQLLLEWEHRLSLKANAPTAAAPDKRLERRFQGLELLHRFKRAYPKESGERDSGSWPEVVEALSCIRSMAGLDGDVALLERPAARHVRALTDIFLAEAARFGDQDFKQAEVHYREALSLFRVDSDFWNIAWVLYHMANMFGESGAYSAVPELCEESLALGMKGLDFEVVALNYRLLGEAAFAAGDVAGTIRNFGLAVEYAYRFQVEPQDPDEYTLQFYPDMVGKVCRRLLERACGDPDMAQEIAAGLRQAWLDCDVPLAMPADAGALLVDIDADGLGKLLFPPALATERRIQDGEGYGRTVRLYLSRLNRQAAAAPASGS